VISCVVKDKPKRDPIFHQYLILAGVGRSIRTPLTIFNRGWVFIVDVIKKPLE